MHKTDASDIRNNDRDNNHIVWLDNLQWHAHIRIDSIFTSSLEYRRERENVELCVVLSLSYLSLSVLFFFALFFIQSVVGRANERKNCSVVVVLIVE